jgi:molybdopterin-guanine dinucleotide biosynthesis protein A
MTATRDAADTDPAARRQDQCEADGPRGVILAGGESSRFGSAGADKALARVGGERCLERIVATVRQVTVGPPIVAVRTADQRAAYAEVLAPDAVQFVSDAPGYAGPLAGLRGAATATEASWLFCCGCDMPLLSAPAIRWLLDRGRTGTKHGDEPSDAVALEYPSGVVEPLHTFYRRESVLAAADRLPNDAGPQDLFAALDRVQAVAPDGAPAEIPMGRSTRNFNTRDELAAIRETRREPD